jgi:hypothetical protein
METSLSSPWSTRLCIYSFPIQCSEAESRWGRNNGAERSKGTRSAVLGQ